jgi:hypothetical protein
MREVRIEMAGDTAIDGQAQPGGDFHIMEYEDNEWVGGCYASKEDLHAQVIKFLEPTEDM